MSTKITKEIICPSCGKSDSIGMFQSIRSDDEELRKKIMDETLFDWNCTHCGCSAEFVYPCLYHDISHYLMVYLVPEKEEKSLKDVKVASEFPQLSELSKRTVTTLQQMKEKILIFESGLDDVAIEVVKAGMKAAAEKKYQKPVEKGLFCFSDPKDQRIGFQFFLKGQEEPLKRAVSMNTYKTALHIVSSCYESTKDDFIQVDNHLAEKILERYQNEEAASSNQESTND